MIQLYFWIAMFKRLLLILIVLLTWETSYYLTTRTRKHADMLLVNGTVYTFDPRNTIASAIAIEGNRIVGIGSGEELRSRWEGGTCIDLRGGVVFPGFIDAHAHVYGLGELMQSVNLVGVGSVEEAVARVSQKIARVHPGEWIYGRGWDQNLWKSQEFPLAKNLDVVSPDNPVVLIRIDGHAIWVNTKAMSIAGVNRMTSDPSGGKIIRNSLGEPTGVFVDNARDLIEVKVPPASPEEISRCIINAVHESVGFGLTEVHDMGIDSVEISIYRELADQQKLPVRIYAAIGAPSPTWDLWQNRQPLIGYGGGMFTLRAMKMYVDGALGSRGAALVEEYSDDPGNRGLTLNDDQLEPELRVAVRRGYQPCVHAIGDRANHIVLDAYEKVLMPGAARDVRPRIEHAQVLLPDDIKRFRQLGVLPSMQPVHATSDMPWAGARLGPDRVRSAYAWRSLLQTGTWIIAGSDAPNDVLNPLCGIYAAITRQDPHGDPPGGWYPEQSMTREEAVRAYTCWAAYGGFEENAKGTIEYGKLADLTILSNDIMKIPPAEILTTKVLYTIVNGKIVYRLSSEPLAVP